MFVPRSCRSVWRATLSLAAIAVIPAASVTPTPLEAQDISYTTVTKMEFGGTMGAMMRMVPDSQAETRRTTFMKGMLSRTDHGDLSIIMNGQGGAMTVINHDSKSYFTTTMGEMLARGQATRERATEMLGRRGGNPGQMPGSQMMMMGSEGGFEPRVSVERTGETMEIEGHTAERVLMVTEMIPTSPETEQMVAATGRQVLVSDSWYSTDLPGYEAIASLYEEMAEEYPGGVMEAFMGQGGAEAFMANPIMKAMMEKGQDEMKGLEGLPVKTVTSFVNVPAGMDFDLEAVLAAADQPLEAGEAVSPGAMAMEAAKGAMGRRLGGLLGRKREEEKPEAPPGPATQTITIRTVTLMEEIRTEPLSDDLFLPPPDYTETKPDWMKGG